MRREIKITAGYDKRNPDKSKDYGVHGANLTFYLHGEKGVIQFLVYTGWMPTEVQKEFDAKEPDGRSPYLFHKPMAADLGYHSYVPMYEGQELMTDSCEVLGGKPCYYDGSGLQAIKVFELLVNKGDEAVWLYMEREYRNRFDTVECTDEESDMRGI